MLKIGVKYSHASKAVCAFADCFGETTRMCAYWIMFVN